MRLRLIKTLAIALLLGPALDGRADLVEVVAKAKPSIVAIGTFDATSSPRFGFRGTGFAAADGHRVVTNAHVLPESAGSAAAPRLVVQIGVPPSATETRTATLVAVDEAHDLALLSIDGPALPALALADPNDVHEGEAIAFIGFPIGGALGFSPVTHRGIISSITAIAPPMPQARQLNEQAIRRLRGGSFDIYQLDATAYPGNSGGPVLDIATGKVVGVINMVLVKGSKESALSQPSGISYAVPGRFVGDLLRSH